MPRTQRSCRLGRRAHDGGEERTRELLQLGRADAVDVGELRLRARASAHHMAISKRAGANVPGRRRVAWLYTICRRAVVVPARQRAGLRARQPTCMVRNRSERSGAHPPGNTGAGRDRRHVSRNRERASNAGAAPAPAERSALFNHPLEARERPHLDGG